MPPEAKFTKEEIVSAALDYVCENGADRLTARELAHKLGSSPRPIFTVFDGMDEVLKCVEERARAIYTRYVDEGLKKDIAFRGVGEAYTRFAVKYPQLFMLLFMRKQADLPGVDSVLGVIDDNADKILDSIVTSYGLSVEQSKRLYKHLWLYTHGIAVSIVTGLCRFDEAEISAMMTEVFIGLYKQIKNGGGIK